MISRRKVHRMIVAAGVAAALPLPAMAAGKGARVVVVGGGFGGATAARHLRLLDPSLRVTLVEPSIVFHTCPASNYVLAGFKTMEEIARGYDALRDLGVDVLHRAANIVDPARREVRLGSGSVLNYDKLILSPGIDLRWGAVEGYDEAASQLMPHAWKAGNQTRLLRRQIEAMPDGGLAIVVPPSNPFRCPPGPYERAAMIAHYFKSSKPRAKVLILDAKDGFSKQALFQDGWRRIYGDMIEWVPAAMGGKVARVEPATLTVVAASGERHRGAVVNVIPPQQAGRIARESGLADESGWCPVDPTTFESTLHRDVHVIGDASMAGAMPKSGFSASSQGKVAALAVVNRLAGRAVSPPIFVNTCYSLIAPDYGISVADVYRATAHGIMAVPNAGGTSPAESSREHRAAEARYAFGWYRSMSAEIWGA
jgi:NADPH-dependent 2,4-dienoyl-CoA reductase/sulfur reductase-like enzyme